MYFFVDTPVLALTGKWSKKNDPGYLKSVDEKRYIIVFFAELLHTICTAL